MSSLKWSLVLSIVSLSACNQTEQAKTHEGQSAQPRNAVSAMSSSPDAVVAQCKVCHNFEKSGPNLIGPNLSDIFGKKAGKNPTFAYSGAMLHSDITWNEKTLDAFLTSPSRTVPGTKMTFQGLADSTKRNEIIKYIQMQK